MNHTATPSPNNPTRDQQTRDRCRRYIPWQRKTNARGKQTLLTEQHVTNWTQCSHRGCQKTFVLDPRPIRQPNTNNPFAYYRKHHRTQTSENIITEPRYPWHQYHDHTHRNDNMLPMQNGYNSYVTVTTFFFLLTTHHQVVLDTIYTHEFNSEKKMYILHPFYADFQIFIHDNLPTHDHTYNTNPIHVGLWLQQRQNSRDLWRKQTLYCQNDKTNTKR